MDDTLTMKNNDNTDFQAKKYHLRAKSTQIFYELVSIQINEYILTLDNKNQFSS